MNPNPTKSIILASFAILALGTIVFDILSYVFVDLPYDPQSSIPKCIITFVAMVAFNMISVAMIMGKRINWREKNPRLIIGLSISTVSFLLPMLALMFYNDGADHSKIPKYASIHNYDIDNEDKFIIIEHLDVHAGALCSKSIIKSYRHYKGSKTTYDTTTYFAVPIVATPYGNVVKGWLLSDMEANKYFNIYENQLFDELIDFSAIELLAPIDLQKDELYAEIISRSPAYDSQSATLPAFYACHYTPFDTRYFYFIVLAGFVAAILGLWKSAKIISRIE